MLGRVDNNNKVCDLGILISEKGKGYGYLSWKFAIKYIFLKKIRKITAGTMSINLKMLKIFKKSKMKFEYKKKKNFLYNNKEIDLNGYFIFKKNYKNEK